MAAPRRSLNVYMVPVEPERCRDPKIGRWARFVMRAFRFELAHCRCVADGIDEEGTHSL